MSACPAPKDGRAEAREAPALRGQMHCLCRCLAQLRVSQLALVVKNLPAVAGDLRDTDLIAGLGRSLGGGPGSPLRILAWRIPWIEEDGRLQSWGLKESDTTEAT